MAFRGSLTSRDQVAVYRVRLAGCYLRSLGGGGDPSFLPVRIRFLPILDLPMMVVIFLRWPAATPSADALPEPSSAFCKTRSRGPAHPIGMYGIADTIIGFAASSLGVKIDVENHGTRFLITYLFLSRTRESCMASPTASCARPCSGAGPRSPSQPLPTQLLESPFTLPGSIQAAVMPLLALGF